LTSTTAPTFWSRSKHALELNPCSPVQLVGERPLAIASGAPHGQGVGQRTECGLGQAERRQDLLPEVGLVLLAAGPADSCDSSRRIVTRPIASGLPPPASSGKHLAGQDQKR
jgi:hypothetical protein